MTRRPRSSETPLGGGLDSAPEREREVGDARPDPDPCSTWIDEGLRALAAGGPDAVRIDTLAKALGVTTGGF
jgi:hypothetical protein